MSGKTKTFKAKINGQTYACPCGCQELVKGTGISAGRYDCSECGDTVIGKQFELPAPTGFLSLEKPKFVATVQHANELEEDESGEYVWDVVGVYCTDKILFDVQEELEEISYINAQKRQAA